MTAATPAVIGRGEPMTSAAGSMSANIPMGETSRGPELFPGADLLDEVDRQVVLNQAALSGDRILPPVTCYAFCTDQDGHPGQFHTSDQTCYGPMRRIPTVMYPPVETSRGQYEQNLFGVYLAAPNNGEQPSIHVSIGENAGVVMSLDEALAVAHAIVASLDEATQAGIL